MRFFISLIWIIAWALPPLSVSTLLPTGLLIVWVVSSLSFGLHFLAARGGLATSVLMSIAALVYISLSLAAAISYFMQGTMPDLRFLAHFDATTLVTAFEAYRWPAMAAGLWSAGIFLSVATLHLWRPARPPQPRLVAVLALLSAGLTFSPGHAMGTFLASQFAFNQKLQAELRSSIGRPATTGLQTGRTPKNLILIYAESLERTYFDRELFGNIVPELAALKAEAIEMTNVEQYPGTEWTIAGIVASQCGLPLISRTSGNQILASLDNPFRDVTCLAEFLRAQGYATSYMGGAPLVFAGKGAFLNENGYEAVFGRDELPHFAERSPWGAYDSQLFEQAQKLRDRLATSDTPYFLTLLTLDTHHPYGHPSPECEVEQAKKRDILSAVSCSDRLIAEFIRDTLNSPEAEDTVIAVFSDHLAMRNTAYDQLASTDRRLLFFILNSGLPAASLAKPGAHFDVGPTLLDAIGYGDRKFGFGQSLLSNPEGGVHAAGLTRSDIAGLDLKHISPKVDLPQEISTDGEQITVGKVTFLIRNGGMSSILRQPRRRDGGFLALAIERDSRRRIRAIAEFSEFIEAIEADQNDLWVVYTDGSHDCQIVPDCVGKPKLIFTAGSIGPSIVQTGDGTLQIGKEAVKQFLVEYPR